MFKGNLRSKPQSAVFKASIEQFGRELTQFFPDRDYTPAYMIKASDDISDISKLKDKDKFGIPLFTYRLDSMSPNRERFNRGTLLRQGFVIDKIVKTEPGERPDDPNKFYHSLHLTPADVTIDVVYYCAYDELYSFGPMWQQAAASHYLNYQLEVGDEKFIPIRVELSEDITFSEIVYDNANYVQFVTSVVISTFHGVISNVRPIMSYKVNTGIVSEKHTEESTLAPSLQIIRDKDTTVFVKNRVEGDK